MLTLSRYHQKETAEVFYERIIHEFEFWVKSDLFMKSQINIVGFNLIFSLLIFQGWKGVYNK